MMTDSADFAPQPTYSQSIRINESWVAITTVRTDPDGTRTQSVAIEACASSEEIIMTNLERFSTFKPGFSHQNHDLSPITTREDFAKEQLQNSLAQAAFWLGVADEWSADLDLDYRFATDLADAMHYTGMAQLRLMD